MSVFVDITPSPRILRILGDIPFKEWQCVAELIDNSLDGFGRADLIGDEQKRIVVSWSRDDVAASDRSLEVSDNGPGMTMETLQSCVKAGYSSNDPFDHLGLYGMGFNIATAHLGEKTVIWSTTAGTDEWTGIEIDFANLIRNKTFQAPRVSRPKTSRSEHGTRVIVSKLKPNVFSVLRSGTGVGQMRKILSDIYTPILEARGVEVLVQSHRLTPRPACVWGPTRSVTRFNDVVPAIITIDVDMGVSLFNIFSNRYLSPDEEVQARESLQASGQYPSDVVERPKRVTGWLGIQRYFDPDDFGIDFIRNGRKILLRNKTLFSYRNPLTETDDLEYPKDLGTSVGGRIVGEIQIDHIVPTYQKNDFDRSDPSWHEMITVLRGEGPILPKKRIAMGYTGENSSPLARLVNAYRRPDVGTKTLAAPHEVAREWAKRFRLGEAEFQVDERWFQAARQRDRAGAEGGDSATSSPVDAGDASSDDVSDLFPVSAGVTRVALTPRSQPPPAPATEQDVIANLRTRSRQLDGASAEYAYEGCRAPLQVTVWEVESGLIGSTAGVGSPVKFVSDVNECELFYNPRHPLFQSYRTTYKDFLLVSLAEKFRVRDGGTIDFIYGSLIQKHHSEARIDPQAVGENANHLFETVRERSVDCLSLREMDAINCVHEASGEVEDIARALMQNAELLGKFQRRDPGALECLRLAPVRTLVRVIDRFPEEFFDGHVFKTPYAELALGDANATQRVREEFKDRIGSYLKDAMWIVSGDVTQSAREKRKEELSRCAHSVNLLIRDLAD